MVEEVVVVGEVEGCGGVRDGEDDGGFFSGEEWVGGVGVGGVAGDCVSEV